jgi:dTDP-4-amino-4,6-dideoxygalactose transaminase
MPLSVADVLSACRAGPSARVEFEEAVCAYHGSQAAFAVSSARAALWIALSVLKALHPDRARVLLPAYTCPTVGRAVLAAGLEGLCIDVSADDFNIDTEQVEAHLDERVLAVIAAHMFGTPCDLLRLTAACDRAGAVLIEDAAQACGACFTGQTVGSFGRMAVLSLGRSKNLRGAGGGVLLVNDPHLLPTVREVLKHEECGEDTKQHEDAEGGGRCSGSRSRRQTGDPNHAFFVPLRRLRALRVPAVPSAVAKQLAVCALSAPRAWSLARRLPWLHIGAEDQSFDERPSFLSPWQSSLGSLALSRLDEYNATRTRLGQALERELAGVGGLHIQTKTLPCESAYVRLALRLDVSREKREAIQRALQSQGIDAWGFYTRPVPEYGWWRPVPDQSPCREAQRLVASNLTLPLHHDMTGTDAARIAQRLAALLSS